MCKGLKSFKSQFYLAGGTALALLLGHRKSFDFDFFTLDSFEIENLFTQLSTVWEDKKITKIQEDINTLSVLVDEVKLSFFTYNYPLLKDLYNTPYFKIASIEDIGCMKLSAILSRYTLKDYVDLYFILKKVSLRELLLLASNKYPHTDENLFLKSLVYLQKLEKEPIVFEKGYEVSLPEIKNFLTQEVKKHISKAL